MMELSSGNRFTFARISGSHKEPGIGKNNRQLPYAQARCTDALCCQKAEF